MAPVSTASRGLARKSTDLFGEGLINRHAFEFSALSGFLFQIFDELSILLIGELSPGGLDWLGGPDRSGGGDTADGVVPDVLQLFILNGIRDVLP